MTTLKFESIILKAAGLGETNPMPDLKNVSYIHAKFETAPRVTPEDKTYFGKGAIGTLLPYLSQDGYDRDLQDRTFQAAILENDQMRAVFLPELGGRLWSLYHKGLQRELLYKNEIVQPCNLGLRNAWVAGGVEWNSGIKGHSPFTCETLFTAQSTNEQGQPILTMYEYERIRKTVFGINALLDGDKLYIRTTIENPNDYPAYTYWWSNIAVPEAGVRVLTDADEMFSCVYEDNHYTIDKIPAPHFAGQDLSYPERAPHAGDVFYITRQTPKRWVAALEADGTGLLQYSTPELIGRKVFFWGQGQGGRNWNRWLTGSDRGYIEIQAGLLRTQMEHIPMAAHSTLSWTECYTAATLSQQDLHGSWQETGSILAQMVDAMPDPGQIDIPLTAAKTIQIPGSGWGALEDRPISAFYPFPKSSLTPAQDQWLHLLQAGYLPEADAALPPESYQTDTKYLPLLEASLQNPKGDHWYTWLHIGILRYAMENIPGARQAWEQSCAKTPNPWAWRNLAMLCCNEEQNPVGAVAAIQNAVQLCATPCRGLLLDAARVLTQCGQPAQWLDLYRSLPCSLQENGRMKLYAAIAHIDLGETGQAKFLLNETFTMSDIKEGELSLSAVWAKLYGDEKPLPAHLNFRMHETERK